MQVSALSVTAEREIVIDFSYLIWEQTSAAMLLTQEKKDQLYLFRPLHMYVWVSFAAAAIVIAVATSQYERVGIHGTYGNSRGRLSQLRNSLWYTYGAMFYQGVQPMLPLFCHSMPSRLI